MKSQLMRETASFIRKCREDQVGAYSAQSAFFIMFSLFPFLMLLISLVQYTPVEKDTILALVERNIPEYFVSFLFSLIEEVYKNGMGLVSVTAVFAIWAAARGLQALTDGLNVIYGRKETRNYFVMRFRAMLYTVIMLITIVLSIMILVFGKSIKNLLLLYIPVLEKTVSNILNYRWLVALVVFVLFFTLLFQMLPNRKAKFRSQLPGGALCAVAWYVFSYGVSLYLQIFNPISLYGSLTTIILLMLWLYFCMYILLVCGELNYRLECLSREITPEDKKESLAKKLLHIFHDRVKMSQTFSEEKDSKE